MESRNSLINWSLLMALVFLWGTSFMFISISVDTVDPYSIVFYRVLLGALVLIFAVYVSGESLPLGLTAWLAFS
jgi:drug/metabolite transporter (DMT)-like permease